MPLATDYIRHGAFVAHGRQLPNIEVLYQFWTNPLAADPDGVKTAFAGPNATTFTFVERVDWNGALAVGGYVVFDHARTMQIVVTHASAVVALSGVITGLDIYGKNISEAWSVTAGGTSKTYNTAKAFKRVTRVTVVAVADATTDTVTIGSDLDFGLLGVAYPGGTGAAIKEQVNGALVTTGVIVSGAGAGPTLDKYGLYTPASAPNGTNDYEIWYLNKITDAQLAPV